MIVHRQTKTSPPTGLSSLSEIVTAFSTSATVQSLSTFTSIIILLQTSDHKRHVMPFSQSQ